MLVGTPVSGRNRSELWDVCGPFLSTLPLRLEPKNDITAGEYLENVKRETLWMLDHQELPLDRVLTELELPRTLGENPLYQVMFTYRPLDVEELSLAGAPLTVVETPHSTAKAELDLEAACTGGKYCFTLEYASSVFQRPAAEFYCRCIPAVLDAFVSRPEEKRWAGWISSRLRTGYGCWICRKQMSAPFRNVPVDVLFSESARRRPDAPAVIFRDTAVTFRELEERACALAGKLQTAGAVPGGRIGLCCRRGPDIFAGMLAILKTGCAYVPFLPEFPRQRVQYMLETADVHLVLCGGSEFPAAADFPGVMPVSMEGEGGSFVPPETRGGLMYILFTSGSTGKPKGVMVSTKAAANYCLSMGRILASDSGRVMCVTNMTFDIFLAEGLLPLSMGRTVVMTDEDERTLPWRMAQRLASSGATTMQITPSQLQMCLGNDEFRAAVKNVKLLLLAGEASNARLVEETAKYTSARQVDVYGPTEATVYVSSSRLTPGEPVTIGTALQKLPHVCAGRGTAGGISHGQGRAVPCRRTCLAEGYVGRPGSHPGGLCDDPMFPGENMYRTGDIARLKADGDIDCLGRRDAQIKLNGLRIELDEINGAATDSGVVTQCVTVPVQADGSAFLRAFAVPADRDADAENKLRAHMRTLLPEYMLPAEFVMLDALPSNASGKVDLPRLKAWEPEKPAAPQRDSPK
jgi:amino acid adenylation domain-containing protein